MKALDLFCGLGGWSDGLAAEGFDVTGVEIEPKIAALYNHRVVISDICDLTPEDFKGYDLIVGSPPCRDFSHMSRVFYARRWKTNPPDPEKGLRLVKAFFNFVDVAKPRFWLLENVPELKNYLNLTSRQTSYLSRTMRRTFFGNYPGFLVPKDMTKGRLIDIGGPLRSWERAKIPMPVARALGVAVKQSILASKVEYRQGEVKE